MQAAYSSEAINVSLSRT